MKKTVLAICLVSALSVNLAAQDQVLTKSTSEKREVKNLSPEERAKKSADRAVEKLSLNSEQKTKWEVAALEKEKANAPLREKMKGTTTPEERKEIHSQMRSNKEKFNTTVVSILTPEQKIKHEQMKQERKKHMHKTRNHEGKQPVPANSTQ